MAPIGQRLILDDLNAAVPGRKMHRRRQAKPPRRLMSTRAVGRKVSPVPGPEMGSEGQDDLGLSELSSASQVRHDSGTDSWW